MKKILLVCLVLLAALPIQNAYSFTLAYKAVYSEHRLDLSSETYQVQAAIGFDGALNEGDYATIYGGLLTGEVTLIGPYEFTSNTYEFYKAWLNPTLYNFSNKTYTFKLYDQSNNPITLEDPTLTTGTMKWLPFVDLTVTTNAGYTWFRWDDISDMNNYGNIDQYWVRVLNPDPSGLVILDEFTIDGGKDSYTFSYYTQDILSTYGEVTFRIEARQYEEVGGVSVLVNRSTLFHKVTAPIEGDLDGDGVVDGSDLAIFAANFGRTD